MNHDTERLRQAFDEIQPPEGLTERLKALSVPQKRPRRLLPIVLSAAAAAAMLFLALRLPEAPPVPVTQTEAPASDTAEPESPDTAAPSKPTPEPATPSAAPQQPASPGTEPSAPQPSTPEPAPDSPPPSEPAPEPGEPVPEPEEPSDPVPENPPAPPSDDPSTPLPEEPADPIGEMTAALWIDGATALVDISYQGQTVTVSLPLPLRPEEGGSPTETGTSSMVAEVFGVQVAVQVTAEADGYAVSLSGVS